VHRDVSRIIYDSKDWFGFGLHWWPLMTFRVHSHRGLDYFVSISQKFWESQRTNGIGDVSVISTISTFQQERKVWSWHVTEGSLNGCRTRGQKPLTELLMTMMRPYTKIKERVLLGKIEWLLCYSSIGVTEQLVAHSSDVILKGSGKPWRVNSIFLRKRGVDEEKGSWWR